MHPVFSQILECTLPQQPNTVSSTALLDVLWLGPDEWLVIAAEAEEWRLWSGLSEARAGLHAAVTLVSDQYAIFELTGSQVREVMAQACSIDWHPRQFRPGQCARCSFARTRAIVQILDETPVYRVLADASYAHYLRLWLAGAVGA